MLENINTIFILESIDFSSRNIAAENALQKANLLGEVHKTILLVTDYCPNLYSIYGEMINSGKLVEGTNIMSVYDFFQKMYHSTIKPVSRTPNPIPGEDYREVAANVFEVRTHEGHVRTEYYNHANFGLRLVENFVNGKRTEDFYYNEHGYLSKINVHDELPYDEYYTIEGALCLKAEYDATNKICKLTLFDDDGYVIREFKDNMEMTAFLLEGMLTANDENQDFFVQAEGSGNVKALAPLERKNIINACALQDDSLQELQADLLNAFIFQTEEARGEFVRQNGGKVNTFVIPLPYNGQVEQVTFESRTPQKAVILTDFEPEENIRSAIDIFRPVVEQVPGAILEIYGQGPDESNCRRHIQSLELEDNVFIKSIPNDPALVFSGAVMAMCATGGSIRTFLESIKNGCPCFAFGTTYVARDVITDGHNGYLIPEGDKALFTKKIVKYLEDESFQRQMSENAYQSAKRFDAQSFLDKWKAMMEGLFRQ